MFLANIRQTPYLFYDNFLLAFSTSSTSLASARSIHIQLRFAALKLMCHRLFQQTLHANPVIRQDY